jgi:hypothetical protein
MIQSIGVTGHDLPPSGRHRSRRLRRVAPILAAGLVAFVVGAVVGSRAGGSPDRAVAARFTQAWQRGDWAAMWGLTNARTQRTRSVTAFASAYRAAAATATASGVRFGRPRRGRDGVVAVPAVVRTRAFGPVRATLALPVAGGPDGTRVTWSERLLFPGLGPGERLRRQTVLPPRAALLFRDLTPLAEGPDRHSPLAVASAIAGSLGPAPAEDATRLQAAGLPAGAPVGISGLERVFDDRLRGTPGGVLYAGSRVLARRAPRQAAAVRTTIAPHLEADAVQALAGRYGGIVALRPGTGEILAAVGVAWSALQPPGSTFKVVTATAALEAGIVRRTTQFPVSTAATLAGVRLENANGESCGGTFEQAFAQSCNSVFAPLGARLGARRLVDAARRFGFGEDPRIPGAATPTIPAPDQIGDDLSVGSSAIGQGRVQATALQMALVGATIAEHGRRPRPTLLFGERRPFARATPDRVARVVERLMLAVVDSGTGVRAAIGGVRVAGKTGTAELKNTVKPPPDASGQPAVTPPNDTQDTDAWFTAYAPAGRHTPRIAVGVLLVKAGAGGDTAAPAARQVLVAGLRR